jgi:outer membrane protein
MKTILFSGLIAAMSCNLLAQNDTIRLTLEQATQLAISSRYDVKADSLNTNKAESELIKSKKELLPDISASGKLTYYAQLQPSIIPAGYLGLTSPEKVAIGMKNNTAFALDLNYTIYKPGLYTDLRIAKNNLALSREKNIQKNHDVKTEISESYYNVLLKELQLDIATKIEKRYQEYFELAKGKFQNGSLIESNALQAELDYKTAKANTEKQKQNYLLSKQYLQHKVNIPTQSVVILIDSLQSVQCITTNDSTSPPINTNRSELKQLAIEQDGNALQLKKTKQNYLPALSVFANYTRLFQGPEFNYSNSFYWAPVNYIGAKFSIPITGSIKNTNFIHESKLRILQTNYALKQKTANIEYEIQQAFAKLVNAKRNLLVAKSNYTLSQKVYELTQKQYGLGAFSYEKLLDTEKSLTSAEQDYITTVYDFLIAKITLQKATGIY